MRIAAISAGALGIGAIAIGALAIGAIAIKRLAVASSRVGRREIEDLTVHRLHVGEILENKKGSVSETLQPQPPRARTRQPA